MRQYRLVLLVVPLLAACGASSSSLTPRASNATLEASGVSAHLAYLDALPEFLAAPAGARLDDAHREDGCVDPDFMAEEPETWRSYSYDGPKDVIFDFYEKTLVAAGWEVVGRKVSGSGRYESMRFRRDFETWSASLVVATFKGRDGFDVRAVDNTLSACPEE